jgi:hypothetical protein
MTLGFISPDPSHAAPNADAPATARTINFAGFMHTPTPRRTRVFSVDESSKTSNYG